MHAWSLNREVGIAFPGGWRFEAQMHYEFLQGAISKQWRITTRGYRYQLAVQGQHVWRIHWHPTVTSSYQLPHVHLNLAGPGLGANETMDLHQPTGRMTYEDAIEWVLNLVDKPGRPDWREVLASSRALHVAHRSWSDRPDL